MKKQNILVLDNLNVTKFLLKKKLKKYNLVFKKFNSQNKLEKFIEKNQNFYAIYCSFGFKINKKILSNLNKIRFIISPTTGIDHIDHKYCKSNNIKIICLKDEKNFLKDITSTAEMTWALILALARNLKSYQREINKKKNWDRNRYFGTDLKNNSIGIIGYGRIGKMVANYAKVFGMKIFIYEKNKMRIIKNSPYNFVSLNKVLKCKFITIHIPLENNYNFLNKKNVKHISNTSYIINTSRGDIFERNTLIKLLKKGYIFGLDVLPGDTSWKNTIPQKYHFITKLKKSIITPHISGNTNEARLKTTSFIINKFLEKQK